MSSSLKQRSFNFIVLLTTFFVNFDSSVVIPIMANYAILLGSSLLLTGVIVGIYSIVHMPSNIILGSIIDKIGRKTPITVGIFLDGFSLLLYALAFNPVFLLVARLIHGLGGGFGGPATMSYFGDKISETNSGRKMALYGISISFSMLFGFMIGGLAVQFIGYFLFFIIISLILFSIGVLSLLLPKENFIKKERINFREEFKVLKNTVLNKKIATPYLSIFAVYFNLGIITALYTIILKNFGYTDSIIGMFLAVMVLISIIIQYPIGIIGDKFGKLKLIILGLNFLVISFIFLIISVNFPFPLVGMIFLGLGLGFIFPISGALIKDNTVFENRGVATGTFYGLIVAGVAIGAPITGLISDFIGNLAMVVGIIIPLTILVLIIIIKKFN